jgi:hypothetical protein
MANPRWTGLRLRWLAAMTRWPLVGRAIGRLALRSLRKPLEGVEALPAPFTSESR